MNTACSLGHFPSLPSSPPSFPAKLGGHIRRYRSYTGKAPCSRSNCASRSSLFYTLTRPRPPPRAPSASSVAATEMEGLERAVGEAPSIKLLFVEMGVGYDQHGQDITKAAMRACRDAISSNSIPAFRRGSVPGVNSEQMKLQIKLGVPQSLQHLLDIERVKSVFP